MDPVKELHVAGFVYDTKAMTGEGFTTTVIAVLGPSQFVVVFTWLT